MIIVMYFAGLLTGLGIWYIAHWVKSEPQIPKWAIDYDSTNGEGCQSRPTPPKPPHNPHK